MENQKGFVALMSVIIISAILLTLIFTLNLSSFFARYDALGGDNKRVSLGLAEACVEAAKLKIAQNAAYTPAAGGGLRERLRYLRCRRCYKDVPHMPSNSERRQFLYDGHSRRAERFLYESYSHWHDRK